MEEVIFKPIYNESVFLTSIVNGLIATSILWIFWTPFVIFLVVPLVNAQIKDVICELGQVTNIQTLSRGVIQQMENEGEINTQQGLYIIHQINESIAAFASSSAETDITNAINKDPSEIKSINYSLTMYMAITGGVVVTIAMSLALWAITKYNLNGPHILEFNLIMALIIMLIEMGFFGLVAMKYVPFKPNQIMESLVQKIVNYIN